MAAKLVGASVAVLAFAMWKMGTAPICTIQAVGREASQIIDGAKSDLNW